MSTYLPPEVLDQIYSEAVQSFRTSVEKDKNYSSFSLVCKNWSGVASRKLLESLKIRNGTHMRLVLKEIVRLNLGHLVKKLEVVFYSSELDKKKCREYEPFTIAQVKQEDMVETDDFIGLAKLLPNLTRLVLSPPSFVRFRRQDLNDLSVFPNVTYLHFTASDRHTELEVLKGLVTLAPRIDYLLLDGYYSQVSKLIKPLEYSLVSLRTLICKSDSSQEALAGLCAAFLLPMSSFEGIETLFLTYFDPFESGNVQILKVAGPTLTSLTIEHIKYSDTLLILSLLPSLKTLSFKLPYGNLVEGDFFQHLPLSLRTLKQPAIPTIALHHYNNNQREGFQLEEIMITEATEEVIQLLPSTISTITVTDLKMVSNLLSLLQSLQITTGIPDSLTVVQFLSQPKKASFWIDPPFEDFPFAFVQDFQKLGIIFQEFD